jgi:hypothetical protein
MREADWNGLATPESLRLEHLVTSQGKGPDKKNRLALIALLPGQNNSVNGTLPSSLDEEGRESAESRVLSAESSQADEQLSKLKAQR